MDIISVVAISCIILLILFFLYLITLYNDLVAKRVDSENALSQIDVQLKRRYDLIPNLVESVKKYLSHEKETLEAVISARSQARGHVSERKQDMAQSFASENMLTEAMGKLFALNESYPVLKGDQTVRELMEELKSTENRISFARQHYNDASSDYNAKLQSFPEMFIANFFRWAPIILWRDISAQERKSPQVAF